MVWIEVKMKVDGKVHDSFVMLDLMMVCMMAHTRERD